MFAKESLIWKWHVSEIKIQHCLTRPVIRPDATCENFAEAMGFHFTRKCNRVKLVILVFFIRQCRCTYLFPLDTEKCHHCLILTVNCFVSFLPNTLYVTILHCVKLSFFKTNIRTPPVTFICYKTGKDTNASNCEKLILKSHKT